MTPKISYRGFEPTDEIVLVVEGVLEKLQDASPYDSFIEGSIVKGGVGYLMEVIVHHADGRFEHAARGPKLQELIFKVIEPILTQIALWAKAREFDDAGGSDWNTHHHVSWQSGELRPMNALIVDDDVESIVPLRQCLQKLGCPTKVVTSGFDAIHEILSGDQDYDVVFLDWQMPEMSGIQAVLNAQKVITHAPNVKDHWRSYQLPVVVYSASPADEIEVPSCRDFKFIDHWQKSIPYKNLLEKVADTFLELKKMPLET